MKAMNDDLQMRSDWMLPICNGKERLKKNGKKVHSTQKPEALLHRIILATTNKNDVMTRPVWIPMHKLKINQDCQKDNMVNTEWLSSRVVNVPSSINLK